MGGKGRATDNAFIESLWKTIKYEKIYPNPLEDEIQLYTLVYEYFNYYNTEIEHSSLKDKFPQKVYIEQLKVAA